MKSRITTLDTQDRQEASETAPHLRVLPAPVAHGQHALADRTSNRHRANTLARQQHDPGPPHNFPRRVAITNQTLKSLPVKGGNLKAFDLAHSARLAHFTKIENLPSKTKH
ncbi:MAG: hypothetical protein ACYC0C_10455 [Devosia sp.]